MIVSIPNLESEGVFVDAYASHLTPVLSDDADHKKTDVSGTVANLAVARSEEHATQVLNATPGADFG